jgi:elongation factor 1 alpha-like protein
VLDQSDEERARGVTIDVGTAFFSSSRHEVNVLDAPGHRDFVPNMIAGAARADVALLVVNAAPGEYESGLSGQTREHAVLARALGVARLIVAVNQMDAAGWSAARFEEVVGGLTPLLHQVGYRAPPPAFVPLAALSGANLAADTRPAELAWYAGGSLLEELDAIEPAARDSRVGTRLCLAHVARSGSTLTVGGTLQAGAVRAGQPLLLLPAREAVTVRSVSSRGAPVAEVVAGDHCELTLAAPEETLFAEGHVLCDPQRPAPVARIIEVQLRVLSPPAPLTRGEPFELYVHAASCCATLRRVVAAVDRRSGARLDAKPPRALGAQSLAFVQLDLERPVAVELYAQCRTLGRIILREGGRTVAVGVVTAIVA